ncbi:SRPBCC family protein [Streptomyces sp. NPDC045431]|uniref:SRPBCC family protein n=1 Tax=Streptomyces sp. NPDC045431 TaxID=3155613 RepID=UPI0033CDB0B8
MEHEVFVPVTVQAVREVLADPARVARCVPGLQQDADASAGPLSGRLKVRAGGHSITYRGTLRVTEQEDGAYAVEGEGTEVRGSGSVKLAMTVRPTEDEGGTTLAVTGTLRADGRLAELPADATAATAHRLLDRFAESLANTATASDWSASPEEDDVDVDDDGVDQGAETRLYDTPVPPSALESLDDADGADGVSAGDAFGADEPPAEAAHARRTMIGRSAEEVDHSPPRGRYAPTPGPETASATATLRWLAPAAALALASAVVAGRALRRRSRRK